MNLFFITVLLVTIGLSVFTSFQLWRSLKIVGFWYRVPLVALNLVGTLIFILRMLFDPYLPQGSLALLASIGFTWLFVAFYSALFFLVYLLVMLIIPSRSKLSSGVMRLIGFGIYLIFMVAIVVMGKQNYNNIEVINLEKVSRRAISEDCRVVFVSDLHIGDQVTLDRLSVFVESINALDPDIVIIGGDLFDKRVGQLAEDGVGEILGGIDAPKGIYYILGNHEYFGGNFDLLDQIARQAGMIILKDTYVDISREIIIFGRDDLHNQQYGRASIADIIDRSTIERAAFAIATEHQPTTIDEAVDMGFDYIFAGHTHKGQLWPFSILVEAVHKYGYGHYMPNDVSDIFVSSGLGIWGPRFRVGSRSEIVVLDIRSVD